MPSPAARPHRSAARQAAVVGAALLLAACSGDGGATPTTAPPTSTAPTTTQRPVDGVLRIGAVLPRAGAAPELGLSMEAALRYAQNEINTKGGVRGQQLDLTFVDEGTTEADATAAVAELVDQGADAIIGPTSSLNVLDALGTATRAGVLVCSPTATALSLDDFPDDDLFFRTAPSDSLQARALVQLAAETGASGVAVAYIDDAYGAPFAEAVYAGLLGSERRGLYAFPADLTYPSAEATAIVNRIVGGDDPAGVVVVIGGQSTGPAMIHAIDNAASLVRAETGDDGPEFVVNDAIRRPDPGAEPFGPSLAGRIHGASPAAYPPNGSFLQNLTALDPTASGLFAVNAYDCLTLIALAAMRTDSFDPRAIHRALEALSGSGASCETFSGCATNVTNPSYNINYDGPSGRLDLDDQGNPVRATFDRFGFDPDTGRDVSEELLEVAAT